MGRAAGVPGLYVDLAQEMNDEYYQPTPEPNWLEKIIIAATVLISWLFFQPKGKRK